MNKKIFDILVWIVSLLFVGVVFCMPETIPVHWDINGNVDGYGNRYMFFIFALLPIITYYGMLLDKRIDPKKKKVKHREIFDLFRYGLTLFFILLGGYFIYAVYHPHVMKEISPAIIISIMFVFMGNYLPKIPQNYTLGIKTPWTLENEVVWRKTHRVGGYGFVISGVFIFIMSFINTSLSFILIVIGAILSAIVSFLYSYLLYKKEEKI